MQVWMFFDMLSMGGMQIIVLSVNIIMTKDKNFKMIFFL